MRKVLFLAMLCALPVFSAEVNPTWDKGEGLEAYLVEVVTADVNSDLEESLPGFDLDEIGTYAKDPSKLAARIGGRANTALWNYVPVLVSKGDEKGALALVTLLRDPRANLNPKVAYQGTGWLSELKRRAAKDGAGQRAAIKSVYEPLSRKRFFGSISSIRTMMQTRADGAEGDLPPNLVSALGNLKSYPVTPDAAVDYLALMHLQKGRWGAIDHYEAVMNELIPAKQAEQPRRYVFSSVNMEDHIDRAQPVVVGIFDSGTEPMRFNMYENPGEVANGVDDDGNGLVDDIHGIVWDWDPDKRHQHSNMNLVEVVPHDLIAEWEPVMIGAYESRMGLDTENTKAFRAKLAGIATVEDQKALQYNASVIGEWLHGTHVAGLATAGNRFARVASFRYSWTGEARIYHERGPSDQELRWERQSIDELIAWINAHDVRVLNASLGFTVEYQEDALARERDVFNPEKPAYGMRDAEGKLTDELDMERIHARAVQIQQFRRAIWKKLFDECPDTLFVLAAGNDDHDVVEYEDVPTTITSANDNLMIVGAVDAEGEWSSFTNFNEKLVRVFDHGVNAVSFTPTGRLAPISGTSQAAPNAAGAVAKLFALFPKMTPQEAREIILESGDPIAAPYYGIIVNEKKAVALAMERHGG